MNKDDDIFEFDAPTTFANLYEIANASDDGADKYFGKLLIIYYLSSLFTHGCPIGVKKRGIFHYPTLLHIYIIIYLIFLMFNQ